MVVTYELPDEILIDIFSWLPAKAVGRCRCLSKQWRDILSTPQFIKSHLARKTLNRQNLLLVTQYWYTIATIKNDAVSKNLELQGDWMEVLGSCDGLVLLETEDSKKVLVNPITQQKATVPNSPLDGRRSISIHGFGYDSCIDDYKIVTLSPYGRKNEFVDTFVEVYNVKTGVWKRVENSPYDHAADPESDPLPGAYVNGAIHWLAHSRESGGRRSVVAAFNLAREVFDEIPAPRGVDVEKFAFNKLAVLGGCLCMIDVQRNVRMDIWIMKEYGLVESWTKFSIDYDNKRCIFKPLCYIGDIEEEIVLVTEEDTLVVYDMKEGILRDMVVDGKGPAMFIDGCIFVESLLSPAFTRKSGGNTLRKISKKRFAKPPNLYVRKA